MGLDVWGNKRHKDTRTLSGGPLFIRGGAQK